MSSEDSTDDARCPLPEERLRYETVSDLRLLSRAFRQCWVDGAPTNRLAGWAEDIVAAMTAASDGKLRRAALRASISSMVYRQRATRRFLQCVAEIVRLTAKDGGAPPFLDDTDPPTPRPPIDAESPTCP